MKTRITIFITLIATFFLFAAKDMITWEREYSTENDNSTILSIKPTSDGGYITGGRVMRMTGYDTYTDDARFLKLDSYGEIEWEKIFSIGSDIPTIITSIIETSSGEFVAVGDVGGRNTALLILKFDKDENLLWDRIYAVGYGHGSEVIESKDGGYIVSGRVALNDSVNAGCIMKISADGDSLWTVVNNSSNESFTNSVTKTDYGCIAVGFSNSQGLIIAADTLGNKLWEKNYGDSINQYIYYRIAKNINGEYVCGGKTHKGTGNNGYLMGIDINGDSLWSMVFSGSSVIERVRCFDIDSFGNYIIAGMYEHPEFKYQWKILKLDNGLDTLWTREYGALRHDYANEIHCTDDGGYIVGGEVYESYVMKLNEYGQVSINNEQLTINNYSLEQNYPNPFNNMTTIEYALQKKSEVEINVYNVKGQFVNNLVNRVVNAGMHSVTFKAGDLNSGVYYYQLTVGGLKVESRKMIYLK